MPDFEKIDKIYEVNSDGYYLGVDITRSAEFLVPFPYPNNTGEMHRWNFTATNWERCYGADAAGIFVQYATDPFVMSYIIDEAPTVSNPIWNPDTSEWGSVEMPIDNASKQEIIVDGKLSRVSYLGESDPAQLLKDEILVNFPSEDLSDATLMGKTLADAYYTDDIISMYHDSPQPPQDIIDEFMILPVKETYNGWATKYYLGAKTRRIKLLDAAFEDYSHPVLPNNIDYILQSVQYDNTGLLDVTDIYFRAEADDVDAFCLANNVPGHEVSTNRNAGLYAVTYNQSDLSYVKIKRYFMDWQGITYE